MPYAYLSFCVAQFMAGESDSASSSDDDDSSDDGDNTRRSVISGKKIKMKVHRTKEMKRRDENRKNLLQFLNQTM